MKLSPVQIAIAYVAAILQMLVVFHKPIGLSETVADILQGISLVCWIVVFVLWKRQKSRTAAVATSSASPSQPKWAMWLTLVVLILGSLSGIFWLPYTGVVLTFPQLVVVSIITCIVSVTVFLIARRLVRPKV